MENSSAADYSLEDLTVTSETEGENTKDTSLRTFISYKDRMEETTAALAAPIRKRVERLLSKTNKNRDKLARQRDEETAATTDLETLKETQATLEQHKQDHEALSQELYEVETNPTAIEEDETKADEFDRAMTLALRDCKYLISQRSIHSNISSLEAVIKGLTAAYEASPDNDHSVAISRVNSKTKELENDLHLSLMNEEEELRGRGNLMLEKAYATQGRVAGARTSDVKPATRSSKSNVKLKYIEIPSFSGRLKTGFPSRGFSTRLYTTMMTWMTTPDLHIWFRPCKTQGSSLSWQKDWRNQEPTQRFYQNWKQNMTNQGGCTDGTATK